MTLAGTLLRALRDGRCAAPRPQLRKAARAEAMVAAGADALAYGGNSGSGGALRAQNRLVDVLRLVSPLRPPLALPAVRTTRAVSRVRMRPLLWLVWLSAARAATTCTGASALLSASECAAWQAGYDAMGGAGWTYCSDKRADPCGCSFNVDQGVSCGGGRVTVINLYKNNLTGIPPVEWAVMTQVTHLQISDNQLSGTLPAR